MTNVFGVLLMLLPLTAAAAPQFLQTNRGRQKFAEVERIARDHSHGEYRGGEMTLKPFIRVDDHVSLGLDESGGLQQVIRTDRRTIAFPMSGNRRLVDLFYLQGDAVVAIDDQGEVLAFDRLAWRESPLVGLRRQMLASFGLTTALATGLASFIALHWNYTLDEVVLPTAVSVGAGGLLHVFFYLMKKSETNIVPDGLRPIGYHLDNYGGAESVNSWRGVADDYLLHSEEGAVSLRHLLRVSKTKVSRIFRDRCERKLALGLPHDLSTPVTERDQKRLLGRRE